MEGQLRELIPFLRDRNPQVRQIALSNLLAHTPKGSPHRIIFLAGLQGGGLQKPKETDIIRDLKLLCRDQLAVAHDAFRALVNLSDSPLLVPFLTEPLFLNFIVSYILNPDAVLADLASMLLSNLTASSAACAALLKLNISLIPGAFSSISYYPTQSRAGTCSPPTPYPSGEACAVLALPLLIDAFEQGALVESLGENQPRQRRGELHFLSSVFANLSTSPNGRSFFLTPRHPDAVKAEGDLEYPLSKIVVFSEHKDTIRRGGVASAMKNCAFHAAAHEALLSSESAKVSVPPSTVVGPGIDILPYLLLPLAGPEELDLEEQERLPSALQFLPSTKTREPDTVLRLTHVETLLLLCTTRWGREYLRANGVYEIVRGAHANETVDKVSEHIERLVMFLKGDEKAEIEEVGSGDQNQEGEADSEDEDGKIEEI